MDYRGTKAGEIIDQVTLQIKDWTTIYGDDGDDTIRFGNLFALGDQGNDVLECTTVWGFVAYWTSPAGVDVNLATGIAHDGFGTVDKLVKIVNVSGSAHDDKIVGNSADNILEGGGGNNTIIGGGGVDTVQYYGLKSTDAKISYDAATDTFTVIKNFSNGDRGIDHLTGISKIVFDGQNSDHVTISPENFVPKNGFLRLVQTEMFEKPAGANNQIKVGDFNGDGNMDWVISWEIGTGTAPGPMYFLLGRGDGTFVDASKTLVSGGFSSINGGGRPLIADFNNDGRSDVFQLDFGNDAPPFPGGINHLLLSSASKGTLVDVSSSLPQTPQLNHAGSVGDVNGDGYLDILVNSVDNGNQLFLNDGTGRFVLRKDLLPSQTVMVGNLALAPTYLSSGIIDVNMDGHPDLILGRWNSLQSKPTSEILINNGTGNFSKSQVITLPVSNVPLEMVLDVKAIDLNNDELPDLMLSVTNGGDATSSYKIPRIQLLINDGSGKFHDETDKRIAPEIQTGLGTGWITSLTKVDFNHDGFDDILATSGEGVPSVMLMNKGDGSFISSWSSAVTGRTVALDVNNDGMTDLVSFYFYARPSVDLNVMTSPHVYKADFGNSSIAGGKSNDTIIGSSGDNSLRGAGGNDNLNGMAGLDVATYSGKLQNYLVSRSVSGYTVTDATGKDGVDTLSNIESVKFTDMSINLKIRDVAAVTPLASVNRLIELYIAFFNRVPDADGLTYWMEQLNAGQSITKIAQTFYNAGIQFSSLTGFSAGMTNADFVNLVYKNVLGRVDGADAEGLAYWTGKLVDGSASYGSLVSNILDSAHSFKNDPTYGYVANLLDNKIAVATKFAITYGLSYNTADESISHGMAIAAAVTPTDISAAISLIGIHEGQLLLV